VSGNLLPDLRIGCLRHVQMVLKRWQSLLGPILKLGVVPTLSVPLEQRPRGSFTVSAAAVTSDDGNLLMLL
jgi:hypothetical protein